MSRDHVMRSLDFSQLSLATGMGRLWFMCERSGTGLSDRLR